MRCLYSAPENNEEAEASLQKSIHKIELLQALYRQERTE